MTNYICPRCRKETRWIDQESGKTSCSGIVTDPVLKMQNCDYCTAILKEIAETECSIRDLERAREKSEMVDLPNGMAGLSTNYQAQLDAQLEDVETKLRHLSCKPTFRYVRFDDP